jgi:hypothetical protein
LAALIPEAALLNAQPLEEARSRKGPNEHFIGLTYQVTAGSLRLIWRSFCNADAEGMSRKNDKITFEGCEPSMLFREFAAECMELAQTASSPEKHALYVKMASVWFQMAQRWEKKSDDGFAG